MVAETVAKSNTVISISCSEFTYKQGAVAASEGPESQGSAASEHTDSRTAAGKDLRYSAAARAVL